MASSGFQYGQLDEDTNPVVTLKNHTVLMGRYRTGAMGLGVSLFVTGLLCLIIGAIGYAVPGYKTNFSLVLGVDIWIGLVYCISGLFGIITFYYRENPALMHAYYGLSIVSINFSVGQLILSIIGHFGYTFVLWHNNVSILLSVLAFGFSLAIIIVLSKAIYCCGKRSQDTTFLVSPGDTNPSATIQQPSQQSGTKAGTANSSQSQNQV